MHIDDGDFLTFASIAEGLSLDELSTQQMSDIWQCEVECGVWRRHPRIGARSRSDISRDGYMGVVFMLVSSYRKDKLKDIIKAGWKRLWTMGDRGKFDYINIWPMIPTLYRAVYGSWVPTMPTLILDRPMYTTGYRAHLTALHIMTEMMMGKRRWSHCKTLDLLVKRNPDNPWFITLQYTAHGINTAPLYFNFDMTEAAYGWGGCPGPVFKALTLKAQEIGKL